MVYMTLNCNIKCRLFLHLIARLTRFDMSQKSIQFGKHYDITIRTIAHIFNVPFSLFFLYETIFINFRLAETLVKFRCWTDRLTIYTQVDLIYSFRRQI